MNFPEYLTAIPAEVPAGRTVVHNSVRPTRHLGERGFRAWLAEPDDRLDACECGWAPELGVHYRVVESRLLQGLPPHIEDPVVLAKVADILLEGERRGGQE